MDLTKAAMAAGERAFPGAHVDPPGFQRFLAERQGTPATWAELFLAYACAQGDGCALEHFEKKYLCVVRTALRHLDPTGLLADEVKQALRVRFFVGHEARILDYLGLGSLEGWVRAAAVRLALDFKRRASTEAEPAALEERLAPNDPELSHLKATHGPAFRDALREAFTTISSRERAVLKLHVMDGASIDRISAVYGIHRATAARWINRIHEALRDRTVAALGRRIAGDDSDANSLVKVLMSELDLSLRRQLASVSATSAT